MKTTLCNMTKYPKIFINCPWGRNHYDYDISDNIVTEKEVNNRNEFIEEFGIVRQKKLPIRLLEKLQKEGWTTEGGHKDDEMVHLLDHVECYYTGVKTKQHVLIYSPYNRPGMDKVKALFKSYSFYEFKPLYAKNATTFVRVF